jgi:hypothetical protein
MPWRARYNDILYSSGTVIADGDSGIIATPQVLTQGIAIFPLYFLCAGTGVAGAETTDNTIVWYADAAGSGGAIGTTTFDQLTLGAPNDLEIWPGDVTAFNAGRDLAAIPPYCKITWDISAGASLSFIIYVSYVYMD